MIIVVQDLKDSIEEITKFISKKWTTNILIDLFEGKKRLSYILDSNDNLSNKVLSERLKEMIKAGYVQKLVINMIPLKIKYQLSMQGYELKNILFEIARFGLLTQQNGVTENIDPEKIKQMRKYFEL